MRWINHGATHRIIPVQTKEKYLEAREDGPVIRGPRQSSRLATALGFIYLVVTVSCSAWYLTIVQPHLENDLWLPQFNSTGIQTYLGDLIHVRHTLHQAGTFDVARSDATLFRSYGESDSLLTLPASAPRQVLLDSIAFDAAITTIRMQSLDTYFGYRTPFCWIDFNRRFEAAHTDARQARCAATDKDNAAVYVETVLRNTEAKAILAWPLFDTFNETVLTAMSRVDPDLATSWIAMVLQGTVLAIPDEIRYWEQQGLRRFTLQFQNTYPQRLDDAILLEDALGMQQRFTISALSVTSPDRGPGSTFWTSLNFASVMTVASSYGCSIVRGAPNDAAALGVSWDTDMLYAAASGYPGVDLIRSHIGPLGAIDVRMVAVPPALGTYFLQFREHLYEYLQDDHTLRHAYLHLSEPVVDPTPSAWAGYNYHGGNLLCPLHDPVAFIQPSFGISDDCSEQLPYSLHLRRENIVFALVASGLSIDQIRSVCAFTSTSVDSCLASLVPALPLVAKWNQTTRFASMFSPPWTALASLNISFMQFATVVPDAPPSDVGETTDGTTLSAASDPTNSTVVDDPTATDGTPIPDYVVQEVPARVFLVQPLVAPGDLWSFYGWVQLHDWMTGAREVYSFEGDVSTLTVLTEPQEEVFLVANDLEIPRKGCFYIWIVTIYVSFVVTFVVALMIFYSFFIGFHVEWWNLFQCNWVIGYVWIGRPFIFLRGMTAMLLLSSSTVTFTNNMGFSRIAFTPKPLVHTMVLAGESTWLTIVLHDIFLPFTDQELTVYAPLSTAFIWATMTAIQVLSPHVATLTIHRTCSYEFVGLTASCTSATVEFGSVRRFGLLFIVHAGSIAISYVLVKVFYNVTGRKRAHGNVVAHVLIPGVAQAFFIQSGNGELFLDRVACVMCGMFSYRDTIFHAPSWIVLTLPAHNGIGYLFDVAKFVMKPLTSPETVTKHKYIRLLGLVGLFNMATSVTGSWAYLAQVKDIMSNDFWWAGFNTTGHQTYLCNWFNRQLLEPTMDRNVELQMNELRYAEVGTDNHYNATDTVVYSPPLYASAIQLEVNTLPNVVAGLRAMQGCDVPWIAAAYCYVDFGRKWEMANSAARQARCQASERQNGAVYLEAPLRNVDWSSLTSCWGDSLSIGVYSYLDTVQDGKVWRQTLPTSLPVDAEVLWWTSHGISEYVTQWQNYKQLGIVETFDVQNAFGFTYPLTIKRSRGLFRMQDELRPSSFTMSWGLASELWAVTDNATLVAGLHLIRQSPQFAFQNVTPADALAQNLTLAYPLSQGLYIVQETLGPFGSVDMKRVACPTSLRRLYQNLTEALVLLLNVNASTVPDYQWLLQNNANQSQVIETYQALFEHNVAPFALMPPEWNATVALCGGQLMCGFDWCGGRLAQDYFSSTEECGAPFTFDEAAPSNENLVKALMAADVKRMQKDDVQANLCGCDVLGADETACENCKGLLGNTTAFVANLFTASSLATFRTMAAAVETEVRTNLKLEMIQFLTNAADGVIVEDSIVELSRVALMANPLVAFPAWVYLFEWVEGRREAVAFQGEKDAITTLSNPLPVQRNPANPRELPLSFSFYSYRLSQYITGVLMMVAAVVCVYIVTNKGDVEYGNIGTFNMVAGLVWVGRPMILLRACSAISVLATANMELIKSPVLTSIYADTYPWFTTFLSTSEVSWLVFVIDDVASVIMKEHTAECNIQNKVFKMLAVQLLANSGQLSWVSSGLWSAITPVHHIARVGRVCTLTSVDMDVECSSGLFEYGIPSRFYGIVLVTFAGCCFAYMFKWKFYEHRDGPHKASSFFLPAVAKYNFNFHKWEVNNVLYLDKPSAVLSGILIFEYHDTLYVFDVKIWRRYSIDVSASRQSMKGHSHLQHFYHALPLVE